MGVGQKGKRGKDMKSFKKALAASLALAMVVTAVPVASAEAATTAKLNTKSVTVAAGTAKKQAKNIKVTTPSTWKSVKVVASSLNKNAATVKVSGKTVKVTAVKKGTAKVTVKVTGKKSGKTVKKTLTATAKVVNAGISFKAPTDVVVGSETKLAAKACPSTAKLTYASSDETVATVDAEGTVKALKAGKTTITIKSDYGTTKTVDINVKAYVLKDVKQTKYNTFEATIEGKSSDLKAADVKITNKANNNVVAVQSVSADATDATKVTITTFASLTDGATYVVTVDGIAKEITVSDGIVADVAVSPLQITANTEGTEIKGQTIDKNGIVLSEFKVSEAKSPIEFTLSTTQGYVNGDKLVLPVVGNKGVAEIKYHTYKYDEKAQEVGAISKKFDIVAVAGTPVTTNDFEVTIGTKAPNWDKDTKNNQFSASDKTTNAYFRFKNSNNKEIDDADYAKYYVVSSDDSVLLLPKTQLTTAKSVSIQGIKAGSAYINVLDKDSKVLTSLPVVVTADRKLTNITFGSTSLVVANNVNSDISTSIKSVDQYGADYGDIKSITAEVMNKATGKGDKNLVDITGAAKDKVVLDANGVKTGAYTVKVVVEANDGTKITRTITVQVVAASVTDPSKATDLRFGLSASEVDLAIGAQTTAEDIAKKDITVSVDAYSDGAKIGSIAVSDVKVNGETKNVTGSTINVTKTEGGKIVKNFAAGTYTVTAKAADKKFSGSFTVKDTQSDSVTAKIESKTTKFAVTNPASVVEANVKVSVNGEEAKFPTGLVTIDSNQYKISSDNAAVYIGTVKIAVTNKAGVTYDVPVVINTTFTKEA